MEIGLFYELKNYTDEFDKLAGKDAGTILHQVKDIWYRQKYLMRIRESVNKLQLE